MSNPTAQQIDRDLSLSRRPIYGDLAAIGAIAGASARWRNCSNTVCACSCASATSPGGRADLVVLDDDTPTLYGWRDDELLDGLIFAGNASPMRDVMVGGNWVVRDGKHLRDGEILTRFKAAIDRLMR
jgi:hypothetical protein